MPTGVPRVRNRDRKPKMRYGTRFYGLNLRMPASEGRWADWGQVATGSQESGGNEFADLRSEARSEKTTRELGRRERVSSVGPVLQDHIAPLGSRYVVLLGDIALVCHKEWGCTSVQLSCNLRAKPVQPTRRTVRPQPTWTAGEIGAAKRPREKPAEAPNGTGGDLRIGPTRIRGAWLSLVEVGEVFLPENRVYHLEGIALFGRLFKPSGRAQRPKETPAT